MSIGKQGDFLPLLRNERPLSFSLEENPITAPSQAAGIRDRGWRTNEDVSISTSEFTRSDFRLDFAAIREADSSWAWGLRRIALALRIVSLQEDTVPRNSAHPQFVSDSTKTSIDSIVSISVPLEGAHNFERKKATRNKLEKPSPLCSWSLCAVQGFQARLAVLPARVVI